ncbi:MAG: folate-binding protein [Methylovulum sp.]|nr:folate-binding protein [Methylovulum sp.]
MNSNWTDFLRTGYGATVTGTDISFPETMPDSGKQIYALSGLAVLTVAGKDAGQFLQGQITCNINDLTEQQSSFGALCNPKGQVITTFLLIKTAAAFWMVLPDTVLDAVKNRLQKYILRSAVTLTDSRDALCIIGLCDSTIPPAAPLFETSQNGLIRVNFGGRYLVIAEPDTAIGFWSGQVGTQGFVAESSAHWRYLDIMAGIPWLSTETSEQFIPQMLNLDNLGAISFTKGCYTGQEIVARTHYLGKAKRALFVAECAAPMPAENAIVSDDAGQAIGKVLLAEQHEGHCKMLIVLQLSDKNHDQLKLHDHPNHPLTLVNT